MKLPSGLRIVITRPRPHCTELAKSVEEAGGVPIELPLIFTRAIEGAMDEVAAAMLDADWIVFTSRTAVREFFAYRDKTGSPLRRPDGCRVAAVGHATEADILGHRWSVDLVPPVSNAESLLETLAATCSIAGQNFLMPRALAGRATLPDGLRERGGGVSDIAIYETLPEPAPPERATTAIRSGDFDVIIFASPSGVGAFWSLFGGLPLEGKTVAAIGSVTSDALAKRGRMADIVPERYDSSGLLEAIAAWAAD